MFKPTSSAENVEKKEWMHIIRNRGKNILNLDLMYQMENAYVKIVTIKQKILINPVDFYGGQQGKTGN